MKGGTSLLGLIGVLYNKAQPVESQLISYISLQCMYCMLNQERLLYFLRALLKVITNVRCFLVLQGLND